MIIPIYASLDVLLNEVFGADYEQFEFELQTSEKNCRIPLTYTLTVKIRTGSKVTLSNNFSRNLLLSLAEAEFNSFIRTQLELMMTQRFEYFNLVRP